MWAVATPIPKRKVIARRLASENTMQWSCRVGMNELRYRLRPLLAPVAEPDDVCAMRYQLLGTVGEWGRTLLRHHASPPISTDK